LNLSDSWLNSASTWLCRCSSDILADCKAADTCDSNCCGNCGNCGNDGNCGADTWGGLGNDTEPNDGRLGNDGRFVGSVGRPGCEGRLGNLGRLGKLGNVTFGNAAENFASSCENSELNGLVLGVQRSSRHSTWS